MAEIKARPTTYKGVKMRSRLEAGYAAFLDDHRFEWAYEPCAFAGDAGQYLPDFRVTNMRVTWRRNPQVVYVEVKPNAASVTEQLGRRMSVIWDSEPNALLIVQTPDSPLNPVSVMRYMGELTLNPSLEWVQGVPQPEGDPESRIQYVELMLSNRLTTSQGPWPDGYWGVR